MTWINEAIDNYYKMLKDRTTYNFDEQTQWCEINTPFYGMFNDLIDIYIKKTGERFFLSDDGDTLERLSLSGVNLSKGTKRRLWCESILNNHGIVLSGTELTATATKNELPIKKHHLISAIIELSEMETVSRSNVESFFVEDVRTLLDELDTIYTPTFIMKGSTGIDFTFDFQLAGRGEEKVIKSFNTLNKSNVPNFLFAWEDIREEREKTSRKKLSGLAIVNDIEKPVKEEFLNALKIKGADYILWSQRMREDNLQKLRPTG